MSASEHSSGRVGLERSCGRPGGDWITGARPRHGIELFQARFAGEAYDTHRHDTYAIGLTDRGVQMFDYRGAARASRAGQAVVLHPDEAHDGRAGTRDGFSYRIVYVQPREIGEALRAVNGRACALPFVKDPVVDSRVLARAIDGAFRCDLTPLAADSLVLRLAEGLAAAAGEAGSATARRIDTAAVERARLFLETERTRVVGSAELEAVAGLTRYELARQFRAAHGTSPYRYLLMRRLEWARERILAGETLAGVAHDAGFADQAHFTRVFHAAVGLPPRRYRDLERSARPPRR
jgi:AraC-like DNA-binding protein